MMVSLVSCIVMMSGCVVFARCLSSSCFLVMPLMLTCNMDMHVARGVLIGLCGVFLGVGASFLLFACVGVECCVGGVVWFRICALEYVHLLLASHNPQDGKLGRQDRKERHGGSI